MFLLEHISNCHSTLEGRKEGSTACFSCSRGSIFFGVYLVCKGEDWVSLCLCTYFPWRGEKGGDVQFFPIPAVFLPFTSDQVWTLLVGTEYRQVEVFTMVSLVSFSQGMMKKEHGIPVNRDSFKE